MYYFSPYFPNPILYSTLFSPSLFPNFTSQLFIILITVLFSLNFIIFQLFLQFVGLQHPLIKKKYPKRHKMVCVAQKCMCVTFLCRFISNRSSLRLNYFDEFCDETCLQMLKVKYWVCVFVLKSFQVRELVQYVLFSLCL